MRNGQREILIGRAPECDLSINDKLLSKVHCHIKIMFDQLNPHMYDWVVVDGHGNKNSCNGTWVYISQDTPIVSNFTFKANSTVFGCKLLNY